MKKKIKDKYRLKELDRGVIVYVYGDGIYEMEFFDDKGKTIDVFTVGIQKPTNIVTVTNKVSL